MLTTLGTTAAASFMDSSLKRAKLGTSFSLMAWEALAPTDPALPALEQVEKAVFRLGIPPSLIEQGGGHKECGGGEDTAKVVRHGEE